MKCAESRLVLKKQNASLKLILATTVVVLRAMQGASRNPIPNPLNGLFLIGVSSIQCNYRQKSCAGSVKFNSSFSFFFQVILTKFCQSLEMSNSSNFSRI